MFPIKPREGSEISFTVYFKLHVECLCERGVILLFLNLKPMRRMGVSFDEITLIFLLLFFVGQSQ